MNTFKSSAELKGISKDQLFGHYGTMVGALLLMGLAALLDRKSTRLNYSHQF